MQAQLIWGWRTRVVWILDDWNVHWEVKLTLKSCIENLRVQSEQKARSVDPLIAISRHQHFTKFCVRWLWLLPRRWMLVECASVLGYGIFLIANNKNLEDVVAFSYASNLKPKRLDSTEKPIGQWSMSREESDHKISDESKMDKWMLRASNKPDAKTLRSFIDL